MRIRSLSLIVVLLWSAVAFAQDDLFDMLAEEPKTEYVTATFKDTRVINMQSVETPAPGVLHFVIQHRFGRLSDGFYDLWGLDNATIRLGLDYGITERLAVGWARSSYLKTWEGNMKFKILRQSTGVKVMPVSLTYYGGMYINGMKWEDPNRVNYFTSRLSYANQLILGRKFSEGFSAQIVPTFIHKNFVPTAAESNDFYSIGAGGRYKLTKRLSINAEYWYLFPRPVPDNRVNSFSLGLDIETGGHVFQLHMTNSRGMFEDAFITGTEGRWIDGDIFFGFNISRVFTVVDKREIPKD